MYRLTASNRAASILSIILVSCLLLLVISTITPDKTQAFARCPNGTHISPSGDCETVFPHAGLERCPNGSHMSPSGICEQVESSVNLDGGGSLSTVPTPPSHAGNTNNNLTPPSSTSQFTGNAGTDLMPPETFVTSVIDGSNSMLMGQGQVQQQTGSVGITLSSSSNPSSNTDTSIYSSKMMFTFAGTDNMAIAGFECSLDRPLPSTNSASSVLVGAFTSNKVFSCSNRVVIDGLVPGTTHIFEVRAVDSSGIRDPSPARFEWRVANNSTTATSSSQNITSLYNNARNITTSNSTIVGSQPTYSQQQPSNMVERSQTVTNKTQSATTQPAYVYKYANGVFAVLYPTNWEIAPRSSSFIDPYYGSATIVSFRPIPNTGTTPSLIDAPSLRITPTDEQQILDTDVMQLKPKSLEQIADDTIAYNQGQSGSLGKGFKLLKNEAITVGGLPARQIQYLLDSIGTLVMDTFVIKDGKLYTITLMSPYSRVPEVLPVAKYIIQSLQFTG